MELPADFLSLGRGSVNLVLIVCCHGQLILD